ncbi:MAG: hypothetical protein RLZZ630_894, partial [Bacteroidota bacterium]
PVVVHVLYANANQNITDAQIASQIEVLNEDFSRLNPDTNNTPAAFQGIAGSPQINFCLAQVDPNGAPTSGIERRQTTTSSFGTNDNIKRFVNGGLDAWDPTQYFNIWVGNLGNFLLGYAEFPTATLSNTYGVVIHYNYFGRNGSAQAPFNKGRTATHEVGHCFGLYHIWGDDGNACSGSDLVADTPNQGGENYGCPAYPLTDNCATANPGVMFMNYMDYTDDACMNLFTQGQSTRVLNTFNNSPYNVLQNSTACGTVNLFAIDARMVSIQAPSGNLCSGTFQPVVTVRNAGADTLTSLDINYLIDNNTPAVFNWTGTLPSLSSVQLTLPAQTALPGPHTFTAYTSNPNGVTDLNPANDSASTNFTVLTSGQALPYSEGFEGAFPPNGMQLINPDGGFTWEQTTAAFKSGSKSAFINNYDYNANGQVDELILPNFDLGTAVSPTMSFWLAYRLYTNPSTTPNYSDTLEVQVSTDCGATYTSIYKKFGIPLVTTPTPYNTSAAYVPIASHWRRDSIDLSTYSAFNNVVLKFKHITDYENNLYLDDINLGSNATTGVGEQSGSTLLRVYPNPAGSQLNIDLSAWNTQDLSLRIVDLTGRLISEQSSLPGSGVFVLDISNLAQGMYRVEVRDNVTVSSLPFIKN